MACIHFFFSQLLCESGENRIPERVFFDDVFYGYSGSGAGEDEAIQ